MTFQFQEFEIIQSHFDRKIPMGSYTGPSLRDDNGDAGSTSLQDEILRHRRSKFVHDYHVVIIVCILVEIMKIKKRGREKEHLF